MAPLIQSLASAGIGNPAAITKGLPHFGRPIGWWRRHLFHIHSSPSCFRLVSERAVAPARLVSKYLKRTRRVGLTWSPELDNDIRQPPLSAAVPICRAKNGHSWIGLRTTTRLILRARQALRPGACRRRRYACAPAHGCLSFLAARMPAAVESPSHM